VFPGGWIWVLLFNNGITSAGVAATDAVADPFEFKSGAMGWERLVQRLPSVAAIFRDAHVVRPFVHLPRVAFQSGAVTGSRWGLLPSAAGFVDPLLSTGFPLTLLGVTRLGRLLRMHWNKPTFKIELAAYGRQTALELETCSKLVGALYASMDRFNMFKQLTLLYFAASSFSEAARRLGKPELARGFLLCRHPVFAARLQTICEVVRRLRPTDSTTLKQLVRTAIEPFDVAGLTDESRDPFYPALVSDVLRNAPKLESTADEIISMLARCGLQASSH
jgi:FADH2 O2-dependent halogenase